MKVLIDTDVLIDVALEREEFFDDSNRVLEWIESGAGHGSVAWHSLSNLAYMMTDARGFIRDLLQFVDIAPSGVGEVLLKTPETEGFL
jgi:predicted nucleic acid-binding protein